MSVVDERTVLQRDAPVVREQVLIEVAQAIEASVDVLATRRLSGVAVRFECSHDRVDVAGRERGLVLGNDV